MQMFCGLRRSFVWIVVFYVNFEANDYSKSIQKLCFPIFLELMCNENQITNRIVKLLRVTCCFIWFSLNRNSNKMHLLKKKLENTASVYSLNNHLFQNSHKKPQSTQNYAVKHETFAYTNQRKCTDIYQ